MEDDTPGGRIDLDGSPDCPWHHLMYDLVLSEHPTNNENRAKPLGLALFFRIPQYNLFTMRIRY